MNKIKTIIVIGIVTLSAVSWGIDEHRPIQGGTTNPTPTGPTDHTRIQSRPEPKVDNSNITLDPAVETNVHVQTVKPKKKAPSSTSESTAASMTNSSGSTGDGSSTGTTPPAPKTKP